MAKVHKSYRLEAETVERVAAWAEEHGTSTTQAMEELLGAALDGTERQDGATTEEAEELQRKVSTLTAQAEAWHEQRTMLGDNLRDLRQTVSTLTAQVAEKDRQIERLQDTVEHSQMLEAAHVGRAIQGDVAHDVSHDGTQDEAQPDAQPRGIWAWLARKIDGR